MPIIFYSIVRVTVFANECFHYNYNRSTYPNNDNRLYSYSCRHVRFNRGACRDEIGTCRIGSLNADYLVR